MSAMCSQSCSTLPMLWVLSITVVPSSRSRRISPRISSALMGSKPLKGSSRISSLGRCSTVVMNCTFWAMPLLSSSTFLFHHEPMSQRSNHSLMRLVASALSMPFRRARYTACSPTFIFL